MLIPLVHACLLLRDSQAPGTGDLNVRLLCLLRLLRLLCLLMEQPVLLHQLLPLPLPIQPEA